MANQKNKATVLHDLNDIKDNMDIDQLKSRARQSAKDLHNFASRISTLAHDFMDVANDELSERKEKLATRVTQKPLQAIAIAFGAGYVVRAIFGRR